MINFVGETGHNCNISLSSNILVWNFAEMKEADIEDIKVEQNAVINFFKRQGKMVFFHLYSYEREFYAQ